MLTHREEIERRVNFEIDRIKNMNSTIYFGRRKNTLELLKSIFSKLEESEEHNCTFHDARKIKTFDDFVDPIIEKKYGKEELQRIKKEYSYLTERDPYIFFSWTKPEEKNEKFPNIHKTPVIFIHGIEKLFYKFDKGDLFGRFGAVLRSTLHQTNMGVFCGTVFDPASRAYQETLGRYHYLFYLDNFAYSWMGEDRDFVHERFSIGDERTIKKTK